MPIAELGHVGFWVDDLDVMRTFYVDVLGLTVTDEDLDKGMVFLSARPGIEHHELVLARGRQAMPDTKLVQQVSFRVDSVESLLEFHRRFKEAGVKVQQEVTHGNAYGIYFWDPEGNRIEVYHRVPIDVRQPYRKDLNQPDKGGSVPNCGACGASCQRRAYTTINLEKCAQGVCFRDCFAGAYDCDNQRNDPSCLSSGCACEFKPCN